MTDRSDDIVTYLGASPVRIAVLEALAERRLSRRELQDAVDTSRTTLWRLLREFEDRHWIRETETEVELTTAGRIILERIGALRTASEAIETLADVIDWLPVDEMDVPIERLAAAEIVRPATSNPAAPMRLAMKQLETATDIRILTRGYSPWLVDVLYEPVLEGRKSVSMVVAEPVLDALNDEEPLRQQVDEMIAMGGLELYRANEPVSHIFAILDGERLGMGIADEHGRPRATLDIEDDAVLEWALQTYTDYRNRATEIGAGRFTD